MSTHLAPGLLPADHVAMMAKGVSVIVSACGAGGPSIMRAVGSRVEAGGAGVTVFLSRRQSGPLLGDLAATGAIAVVFSEPISHRTVQVKASRLTMRSADTTDLPALQAYRTSMEHEVGLVGFAPAFVRAMLAFTLDDLVAVHFVPEQAFNQAPGPRAGATLAPDAAGAAAP